MDSIYLCIVTIFFYVKLMSVSSIAPFNQADQSEIFRKGPKQPVYVEVISVGNFYPTSISSFPYAGPGLDMGMDKLRTMFVHHSPPVSFKQTFVYDRKYRFCDDVTANVDQMTAEYFYSRKFVPNITAFIAPGCTERINLSKLIRGWNALMMIGGNGEIIFRNKALFPNVLLAGENAIKSYTTYFATLLRKFNWSTVYIVADQSTKPFHALLAPNLYLSLKEQADFKVILSRTGGPDQPTLDALLADVRQSSRIVIFLGYAAVLRVFMLKAQKAGMTGGDYVYFALEPFKHSDYGNLTWKYNDKDDEDARKSFRSLLVVTSASSSVSTGRRPTYDLLKNSSSFGYNFTYAPGEVPNPFVTASLESMLIFGTVLQEMLAEQPLPDLSDGSAMARRFWNRTFSLSDPYPVSIVFDNVGERKQLLVTQQFVDNVTDRVDVAIYNETTGNIDMLTDIQWPITWPPVNEPVCGYLGLGDRCRNADARSFVLASALSVAGCVFVIMSFTIGILRFFRASSEHTYRWLLSDADVQLGYYSDCKGRCSHLADYRNDPVWATWTGVEIRSLPNNNIDTFKSTHNRMFSTITSADHRNVNRFVGLYLEKSSAVWIISAWNRRESLDRLLNNVDSHIADWDFKVCLVSDLVEGLHYIHQSPMKYHGSLTPRQCLLDAHFTLLIGSLGYDRIRATLTEMPVQKKRPSSCADLYDMFHFRSPVQSSNAILLQQNDIKAFKDIVFQICFPLRQISDRTLDPYASHKATLVYKFQESLVDTPTPSLSMASIGAKFRQLFGRKNKNVVEAVLAKTTSYAETLEEIVATRTVQLKSERQKADDLLAEILPRSIVHALRNKLDVVPEYFDSVTLAFSDLPGFALWVNLSSAATIIELLSNVYTAFDEEIARFDAYKLETVGDNYVVSSGLPTRNGNRHALEICYMTKSFLARFKALHLEKQNLQMRIGIHSGPCAAGVVGNLLPRYCVFGDVVNTASRMETTGEPGKIQASASTAELVPLGRGIIKIPRGEIDVKGKGQMRTYWIA